MKKIRLALLLLILLIILGTCGYVYLEKWGILDSLYMTVITISTVGFHEIHGLNPAGKIFTIFLIISSVGIFAYAVTIIGNFIIEGQFSSITRRKIMEKKIASLTNHYIICGADTVAKEVIKEFIRSKVKFILLSENLPPDIGSILGENPFIIGDSTSDELLQLAKIEKAKGLISCLPTDKENLFVVISARNLNPKLKIMSLAKEETSLNKIIKAGADNVIFPEIIGGRRMASMILRPEVLSFLDVMTTSPQEGLSLKLEELTVTKRSSLANLELKKAQIPQKTGLLVVAIKKKSGFLYNPSSSTVIEPNDKLIVLGKDEQIQRLKGVLKA